MLYVAVVMVVAAAVVIVEVVARSAAAADVTGVVEVAGLGFPLTFLNKSPLLEPLPSPPPLNAAWPPLALEPPTLLNSSTIPGRAATFLNSSLGAAEGKTGGVVLGGSGGGGSGFFCCTAAAATAWSGLLDKLLEGLMEERGLLEWSVSAGEADSALLSGMMSESVEGIFLICWRMMLNLLRLLLLLTNSGPLSSGLSRGGGGAAGGGAAEG